jgi:hypothetical protein
MTDLAKPTRRIFQYLFDFVAKLPPTNEFNPQSSLKLRQVVFELYSELIYQNRFHQTLDTENDKRIACMFEQIIEIIHNHYQTQQYGSVFAYPQY